MRPCAPNGGGGGGQAGRWRPKGNFVFTIFTSKIALFEHYDEGGGVVVPPPGKRHHSFREIHLPENPTKNKKDQR